MAKTLLDLASSLEKRAAKLNSEAARISIETASAILGDLVYATPVDSSKALSNWQVSLGSKISSSIDPHYPGKQGSTYNASASTALEIGRKILLSKQPGVTIYISNVLPYIQRLNDGYSKQTPAGFVERATLIGRRQIKKAKLRF